jgi:L,D-peptidoglycan transpeptidase YkuD (ErfK/YbiS/YcfS/YnhG family)
MLLEYFKLTVSGRRIRIAGDRYDPTGIEILVVSFVLAGLMEVPVFVKIIAGTKGTQTQDSFGPLKSPLGACNLHAIFYQMPTSSLDNTWDNNGDVYVFMLFSSLDGRIPKKSI